MVGGATQIKGEERSPVSRQAGSAPTSKKDVRSLIGRKSVRGKIYVIKTVPQIGGVL